MPLSDLEIMTIQRVCERLVLDFADCSDRQDYDAMILLFTENAILTRPSGDSLAGRAAILKSYQSKAGQRITRHVCTNIRVAVDSADAARGLTYAVIYSAKAGQASEGHFGIKAEARQMVGEFEDEFVRTPEGWRFSTRRARFVMHTS